jgi:hypothetical protein
MAPPEDALPVSESTSLLAVMPSANSTDDSVRGTYSNGSLPLTSSYDELRESAELQMQALIDRPNAKTDSANHSIKNVLRRRHAILILLFGCALCVMLISLLIFQPDSPPGNITPDSPPGNITPDTPDDHPLPLSPLPFSDLDPVNDLGLMEFIRPDSSSPPTNLFRRLEKSKKRAAYPTNAWYQNFLLARGEPSNVHRAYAVPYVLDAVGLIPGLRVIPANRILAGNAILQLYINEPNGLTLGATGDLQGTTGADSHAYTVLETTELGLSLHWVRLFKQATCVMSPIF